MVPPSNLNRCACGGAHAQTVQHDLIGRYWDPSRKVGEDILVQADFAESLLNRPVARSSGQNIHQRIANGAAGRDRRRWSAGRGVLGRT
jgi:hypothetical protein